MRFYQSTIGIFIMKLPGGVTCRNTQPVADFSECRGYCPSRDTFNTIVNDFESTCKCCASKVTRDVQIQLSCDNGTPTMHTFRQPVSCECKTCNLESKDAGWEVPGAVPEKKRK
ncbi:PREDICTED: integumentary mucin B.1-like isoform X2 [Priapulus caudatus]|uniref:Integumentary mucin B.1-like isoform X2 n=1 Tax=Priapulus caudatus TaxID=37621 RepID=A0ABM1DS82_PRICU|nr:PREDICTED: integumentary mucin B.1-like isoform X2 [Priapulus caudatus]